MTVSTTNARYSYSANGSQTAFSFPRFAQAAADFVVTVTSSTGVESVKTLTTDYTVTGAGTAWTITFGVAPASGSTVVIFRDPSPVQETDFEGEGDPLNAMTDSADRVAAMLQALRDSTVKKSPGTDTGFDPAIPNPASGTAGYALVLNSGKTGFIYAAAIEGVTVDSSLVNFLTAGPTTRALVLGDGSVASPSLSLNGVPGGLFRDTSITDPVYGGTFNYSFAINGVSRVRILESVISCTFPAGDNFGITDGTRTFHVGNNGVGFYAGTTTSHPFSLTYAGAGKLKLMNATQIGLEQDGTALLPAFTWVNDATTGFYRIGAFNIGIAVNGVKVVDIGTAAVEMAIVDTRIVMAPAALAVNSAGFRGKPINQQDGNYTLVLADAGKAILHASASAHAYTIPPNVFPIGTEIDIINGFGAGAITLTQGSGVTLARADGTAATGNRTLATSTRTSILQTSLNTWYVSGPGIT